MDVSAFLTNEEGQSMVETALIIALVALGALLGLGFFGEGLEGYYNGIVNNVRGILIE